MDGLLHYEHLSITELTILLETISYADEDNWDDESWFAMDTTYREMLLNNRPYLKLMQKSIRAEIEWLDVEDTHTVIEDAK